MKPEWCSDEVWDAAKNEAAQYVEWLEPKPEEYAQSEHVLAVSFARALLDAHQRGREEGMEEAAWIFEIYGRYDISHQIRAKMEEQP